MPDRIPPLNALRAFEAVGRHLNMTRAAKELFVTPAAVSHQIIALETYLGRKLFERQQHGLALTTDGAAYLPQIRKGFDNLRQASEVLDRRRPVFTISVPPAFSAKWLMPRLKSLRAELPSIAIVNEGANDGAEHIPAGVDVAVRYGRTDFFDVISHRMLEEVVIPVCHPELLVSARRISGPAYLLQFPLLYGRASLPGEGFPSWETWFRWAGLVRSPPPAGIAFDHHLMTVQAALEGQGVALAKRSIVMTDLIRGNLVQPWNAPYPLAFAHFLVCKNESPNAAQFEALRLWFERELADTLKEIPTSHIA